MRIDTPTNASAQRAAPKRTPHSAGRGTRHIARLLAAVLGFVVVCADGLAAAAAPLTKKPLNQQDKPLVVVSLGDSYSSGEGLEEFDKEVAPEGDTAEKARIIAHRSTQSWPGLLTFTDASGATIQLKDYYCPPSADGIVSGEGTPPIDGTEDTPGTTDKTDKAKTVFIFSYILHSTDLPDHSDQNNRVFLFNCMRVCFGGILFHEDCRLNAFLILFHDLQARHSIFQFEMNCTFIINRESCNFDVRW